MRRVLRWAAVAGTALLLTVCVALAASFVHHRNALDREDALLDPPGTMVSVDGHRMHVYTEGGEGAAPDAPTLVFLSGGGTASPVLDFTPLFSRLSGDFRIAVVERLGYGFSDVADEPRDVDTVLSETRQALGEAGVHGPYVLFPHSMAGLAAIRWAQLQPEEVAGIVGLDAAVPQSYSHIAIPNSLLLHAFSVAAKLGLTRLAPSFADGRPAIASGGLSAADEDVYRAILYRRTETTPMIREIEAVKENAEKVGAAPPPQVPMLFFTSNGEGTGIDTDTWRGYQRAFLDKVHDSRQVILESGHYVHDYETDTIAGTARNFIDGLDDPPR
ncbi:alpha/beta fold hydrolase [Tomitella fengzijianii]|uniref:Alpha/beta hydrolase n=1 Tax=Tomitella fengzijianii TaxID=2597660 RepID=A0A516X788_9ACTN|nr:alpha/beta hydrolase [Tomitella fengzijianii]QDQ98531.1 alpha/beta hydrolase [Tomitella fengzijianii]